MDAEHYLFNPEPYDDEIRRCKDRVKRTIAQQRLAERLKAEQCDRAKRLRDEGLVVPIPEE